MTATDTQLLEACKKLFPDAKYIESTDWQVEDDSIELTPKISIQICFDGGYGLSIEENENEFTHTYVDTPSEILLQVKKLHESTLANHE